MLQRYPSTIRWRQFLPPAFLLGLIFLAVLSIFFKPAVYVLTAVLGIYLLVLLLVGLSQGNKEKKYCSCFGCSPPGDCDDAFFMGGRVYCQHF